MSGARGLTAWASEAMVMVAAAPLLFLTLRGSMVSVLGSTATGEDARRRRKRYPWQRQRR
jgi:hypothetical protein